MLATIVSANSEMHIADAICSARDFVEEVLLIDTGITDGTRRVAEELLGERLVVESFPWCNDFAKARNFALDAAARHGADWALTLDTDERLEFPGYRSKEELLAALESDPKVHVWLAMEKGGTYAKERFVRVGDGGQRSEIGDRVGAGARQVGNLPHVRWVGRVHEALVGARPGEAKILPGVLFWEVKKSPEAYQAKLLRDLAVLEDETRERPDDPRWWYYLGQTLGSLKRQREAALAFRRCAALPGWAEQAAWACYKGAEALCDLNDYAAAVELCAIGLARQPGSPELAWLAGWCAYQQGKLRDAIHWERMAIALGNVEGCQAGAERISFRHLPGWYEGPYDVLRYAYLKLGDRAAAARTEGKFREAVELRQGSRDRESEVGKALAGWKPAPQGRKVLLDLGTHYGEGLRKLQPLLGLDETWEIHSFEPNPACHAAQRLRDLPLAVQFHAAAIWTRDGTVPFRQENHQASGSGSPADGRSEVDGWGSCLAQIDSRHAGLESPIETPCVDLARILGEYSANDHVVVKMDIEGAEFAVLRHALDRGVAQRIKLLLVEWHERFVTGESAASRNELEAQLSERGVRVVRWD